MAEIKTYSNVKKDDDQMHFGISRMEDIYERHAGKPDLPHRHEFFTILLTMDADGTHIIDFEQHKLKGQQAHFIAPGQVHQLVEDRKSQGACVVLAIGKRSDEDQTMHKPKFRRPNDDLFQRI